MVFTPTKSIIKYSIQSLPRRCGRPSHRAGVTTTNARRELRSRRAQGLFGAPVRGTIMISAAAALPSGWEMKYDPGRGTRAPQQALGRSS